MRRSNKVLANYSHCVERGDSLNVYYEFVDANEQPIYLGYYDFSLILKPKKQSSEVLFRWNTSQSAGRSDGIFKLEPPASGNFSMILTDNFTETIEYDELYYNIEVTSASMENEILEGGIRFVTEQQ